VIKLVISYGLLNLGLTFYYQGDFPKAVEYYEKSLKISEDIGDKQQISKCFMNLGMVFDDQGNRSKAISYYERSLKISEDIAE